MKSRGFTLTEILGVIVVISLLLLLIMPTISNRIVGYKDETATSQEKLIYQASDLYLDESKEDYPNTPGNIYCVTLKQLMDTGKLVNPVKKAVEDGNYSDDTTVQTTISNNAVRTHQLVKGGECKVNVTNDIVIMVTKEKVWAKAKTVTVYYPKLDGNYNNEYRTDNGSWKTWNGPLTLTKNSTVEARAVGKTIISKTKKVDKIDNTLPIVTAAKGAWNDNSTQNLIFTLKDMDSGVAGYYITTNNTMPALNDSKWIKYNLASHGGSGSVTTSKPLGTYYIFVKDKAGNVANTSISVVDTIKPTCEITSKCSSVDGKCTLTITADDKGGSGLKSYGFDTYNGQKTKTVSVAGNQYGQAIDYAGNVGTCQKYVIIPPSCKVEITSGAKGNNNWYVTDVGLKMTTTGTVTSYGLDTKANSTNGKSTAVQKTDGKDIQYYGYVANEAGYATCISSKFSKDATPPTKTVVDTGWYTGGWTTASVPRVFKATDATSGVDHYEYSSNCSGTKTGDEPSDNNPVTWEGVDSACQRAVDKAGNAGPWSDKVTIYVDKHGPSLWCGWTQSSKWGSCNGEDTVSGIKSSSVSIAGKYYYVNVGANCRYNGPHDLDINKNYGVYDNSYWFSFQFHCGGGSKVYWDCPGASDNAGNWSGGHRCGNYSW